jgi:hypothetical protein
MRRTAVAKPGAMFMRYRCMPPAEPRPGDSAKVTEALDRFLIEGIDARRPPGNAHQIKVSEELSYYPDTGRIVRDGSPRLTIAGLNALLELLRETARPRTSVSR